MREAFKKAGIEYRAADLSKSDIYRDFLPRLNSGEVDLLDSKRLSTQLIGLERRTARGGRDSIDHAPGGKDDLANSVAGALVYISSARHQAYHGPLIGNWINGWIEMRGQDERHGKVYSPPPPSDDHVDLRDTHSGAVRTFHKVDAREILAAPNTIYRLAAEAVR